MSSTLALPAASHADTGARAALLRVVLLLAGTVLFDLLGNAFAGEKLNFLYKDQLGLDASMVATVGIIVNLPTYLQPLGGSLSELVPLFGYHRRSYYALAVVVEAAGVFALAVMPHYRYLAVIVSVIIAGAGGIMLYVVAQAIMVQVGNATGQIGRLQTVSRFVGPIAMILFGAHLSGYVTQHWSYHACFIASALATLLSLPLTLLIDERRVSPSTPSNEAQRAERLAARRASRAETSAALRQAVRSPGIWAVIGLVFMLQLVPEIGTARFFFAVDYLHLSKQTIGDLSGWASAGALIGIAIFALVSPRLSARAVTWLGILMSAAFYVPLFFMHDAASAKAANLLSEVCDSWYGVCIATLVARVCPRRIEGTVYALYGAASALGWQVGNKVGSVLYDHFGAHHHIVQGWYAMLWVGTGFALLTLLFIPFLPSWARSRLTLKQLAMEEEAMLAAA